MKSDWMQSTNVNYNHTLMMKWYGIVEFNVPLDTVYVISETALMMKKRSEIRKHCAPAAVPP